ncbi:hypothetical protein M885DRAFT_589514 [Pelagophyceae sp. CCMP2097]|nr:hypothetical protein M885DRAFT_589514 [Pelagophyceae sp. CCMP2097]
MLKALLLAVCATAAVAAADRVDSSTGISFPQQARFSVSDEALELCGVGARVKAYIIKIYSVGFYAAAPAVVSASGGEFSSLCSASPCAAVLTFKMGIGAQKVAEALAGVAGVDPAVLSTFQALLVDGMGGYVYAGESLTLEWAGSKTTVGVRGNVVGSIDDQVLTAGLIDMYTGAKLGNKAVSPALRKDMALHVAEIAPGLAAAPASEAPEAEAEPEVAAEEPEAAAEAAAETEL